jgi:hypothetical protein
MKLEAETFYPLILNFLTTFIGDKECKEFARIVEYEEKKNSPLKDISIEELLSFYLKHHPSLKKKLSTSGEKTEVEPKVEKKKEEKKEEVKKETVKESKPKVAMENMIKFVKAAA